jgi:aconitate hydratase
LPLVYKAGETRESLGLTGEEVFDIEGLASNLKPGKILKVKATSADGKSKTFEVVSRIDTPMELEYYKNGGILLYVLRMLNNS